MSATDQLVELLVRWEESVEQGHELTPNELCPADSGLCALLTARIQQHRAFHKKWAQADTSASQASTGTPTDSATVLDSILAHCQPAQTTDELGRLGIFRLLRMIGFGGMGAVFEAEDSQLQRRVAIKILRPHLAVQSLARQRFLREARAVAALEHDHVVAIHYVGQEESLPYFSMPLLRGELLETRLKRQRILPATEAIRIAAEVADGLAAAHATGLIHRDIKPSNIWLADNTGRVKILDFGLVKAVEPNVSDGASVTGKPCDTPLTDPDSIPGTLAYMSPEQVQGFALDARSDVFSLGVVLYEMVTGRKPFAGANPAALMNAVIAQPIQSPRSIQASLGAALDRLIHKALSKNPNERPVGAAAFRAELLRTLPQRSTWWRTVLGLSLAICLLTTPWWLWNKPASVEPHLQAVPFTNSLGREITPCFSPSGEEIAFVWTGEKEDNVDIYVKGIADVEPRRLTTHSAVEIAPTWSPTGDRIAFSRFMGKEASQIVVLPKMGGTEEMIWQGEWVQHMDWSPDGKRLALSHETNVNGSPILLLDIETRQTSQLSHPEAGVSDSVPKFSPDGGSLAFVRKGIANSENQQLCVISLADPKATVVLEKRGVFRGVDWTPNGKELVFSFSRTGRNRLWRIAVQGGEPREIRLPIEAATLFPSVARKGNRLAFMVLHDDWTLGRLPIASSEQAPTKLIDFLASARSDDAPAYSADGKRVVFSSDRTEKPELWVYDFVQKKKRPITRFDGPSAGSPRWSPDGRHVVFDSNMEKNTWIYVVDAEGVPGNFRKIETHGVQNAFLPCWSHDGKSIFFTSRNDRSQEHLWKVPSAGGQALQMTFTHSARPLASPDGQWIYFNGTDNGICRMPVSGGHPTPVLKLPNTGDMWNAWDVGKNGIYYLDFHRGLIQHHPFAGGESRTIGTFRPERRYLLFGRFPGGRIAVAPNDEELIVVQFTRDGSGISLVEDFR